VCQYVVTLAERDGHRYISQCEHGTVHLVWDAVGFHLPADAFLQLANRILQTANTVSGPHDQEEQAHCLLQVGRIAVALLMEDFLPLAEMVAEALPLVDQLKRDVYWCKSPIVFPYQQQALVFN